MKIFAISDLHLSTTSDKPMEIFGKKWHNYMEKITLDWNEKVSENDLVLIAGDLSWAMKLDNALIDLKTLEPLKGKKLLIRGNHDYWWQSITRIRQNLPPDFFALQNDAVKFNDTIICGTRGWTVEGNPDFGEKDKKLYLRESERLALALKNAEKLRKNGEKLIAMIHYPPFNVRRDDSLFTKLFDSYNVNAVVYGHLHGEASKSELKYTKNGINYYLTSCDRLDNKLTEIIV